MVGNGIQWIPPRCDKPCSISILQPGIRKKGGALLLPAWLLQQVLSVIDHDK